MRSPIPANYIAMNVAQGILEGVKGQYEISMRLFRTASTTLIAVFAHNLTQASMFSATLVHGWTLDGSFANTLPLAPA